MKITGILFLTLSLVLPTMADSLPFSAITKDLLNSKQFMLRSTSLLVNDFYISEIEEKDVIVDDGRRNFVINFVPTSDQYEHCYMEMLIVPYLTMNDKVKILEDTCPTDLSNDPEVMIL